MSDDQAFYTQQAKKITIATLEYEYSIFITELNTKRYRVTQWIQWYGQKRELHLGDFSNFEAAFKFCEELVTKIEKKRGAGVGDPRNRA